MSIKEQKTKLMILESRILKWKLAGPEATNADPEWRAMNKDLALVRNFIRALKRYPDKNRLQVSHMKMLNTIWHRYGTKQGQPLNSFMGGVDWIKQLENL